MRVVNVRDEECTHYIGRGRGRDGWIRTGLGNPFRLVAGDSQSLKARVQAIKSFQLWALEDPRVLERIRQLPEDAVLGCWCKPKPCHGDVIVELWERLNREGR